MSDNLDDALDRAREQRSRSTFTDNGTGDVNAMMRRAAFGEGTPETEPETPRTGGSVDGGKGTPTPTRPDMNTLLRKAARRGY